MMLHLDEEELDELKNSDTLTIFPPTLLINYYDVQNVIIRKMNNLSRKHYQDKISIQLWLTYLKEQKKTLHSVS